MEKEARFHIIAPKHLPSKKGWQRTWEEQLLLAAAGIAVSHTPCLSFLTPWTLSHMSYISPVGLHCACTEVGRGHEEENEGVFHPSSSFNQVTDQAQH